MQQNNKTLTVEQMVKKKILNTLHLVSPTWSKMFVMEQMTEGTLIQSNK